MLEYVGCMMHLYPRGSTLNLTTAYFNFKKLIFRNGFDPQLLVHSLQIVGADNIKGDILSN